MMIVNGIMMQDDQRGGGRIAGGSSFKDASEGMHRSYPCKC